MKVEIFTNDVELMDFVSGCISECRLTGDVLTDKKLIVLYNVTKIDYNREKTKITIYVNNIGLVLEFDKINNMFIDKMN